MKRQSELEAQIIGLNRHAQRLTSYERRFVWLRLVVFSIGLAASWYAAAQLPAPYPVIIIMAALLTFSIAVGFHRRLDGWMQRFQILRELRASQLARMTLDWEHITYLAQRSSLDTRTALELDLDLTGPRSLQHLIDFCISQDGSQRLASWLTLSVPNPEETHRRQEIVKELAALRRFRERLLLILRLVSKEQLCGERMLAWLNIPVAKHPLQALLLLGIPLAILNFILFWLNVRGTLAAFWPFSSILMLVIFAFGAGMAGKFLNSIVELDAELDKFRRLLAYLEDFDYHDYPHLALLCAPFTNPQYLPSRQIRQVKWITTAVGLRSNPILGLLLNIILPWDIIFSLLAASYREQAAHCFPGWVNTWAELDALCSLANFADLNPDYCFPTITSSANPPFHARELGHPLIPPDHRVTNDFTIPSLGEVAVITGSNMAGKSTLIKTVGINLCLAYAGGPVSAANLVSLPFRLHSCIHISDSITDGFSYFYAEVKCLKSLLESLQGQNALPLLYMIDEIFRGTNNRERLVGSRAFTRALIGANGAGLIATHDLQLAALAEESEQVKNYHFRDSVADGKLTFDYTLRSGPCPTTNALKIMRQEGLPVDDDFEHADKQ
ncbi:MAG: hypothetical protein JW726_07800 [Anaerolineales bacterium]|nr:hypothetical protein [Anaerolineales bacterium]